MRLMTWGETIANTSWTTFRAAPEKKAGPKDLIRAGRTECGLPGQIKKRKIRLKTSSYEEFYILEQNVKMCHL